MSEEQEGLNEELDRGDIAGRELAEHLHSMRAAMASLEYFIEGRRYKVTVELVERESTMAVSESGNLKDDPA